MLNQSIRVFQFCNGKFPMLTREFIYDRLYHREDGYFTNKQKIQLGQLKKIIHFNELLGYEDYMNALQSNYPENAWLTPSEIFRPYYGITIGNYIYQQYNYIRSKNTNIKHLRIMEAGAGFGAACEGILTFYKLFNPLQKFEYHIVEISGPACEQCEKRLHQAGFGEQLQKGIIRIIQSDVLTYSPPNNTQEAWFHLFLEVFDNLPQDRVYGDIQNQDSLKETWVNTNEEGKLFEEQRPLSDALIKETAQLYKDFLEESKNDTQVQDSSRLFTLISLLINKYYGAQKETNIFLPTQSLKVLRHLDKTFPHTKSLVLADFDTLHNIFTKGGTGSPIVSQKLRKAHEKKDFPDYLVERGQADIFFPTNFRFMKFLHNKIYKKSGRVMRAHEFVDEFAREKWTTTKSGYNPLKEDFSNTSFLLTNHE